MKPQALLDRAAKCLNDFIGAHAYADLRAEYDDSIGRKELFLGRIADTLDDIRVRARALPECLKQSCEDEYSIVSAETVALRVAYTAKAVVCLVLGRTGWPKDWPSHKSVHVAAYDHEQLYAGWKETIVTVPEPWWKNFAVSIEDDGDWWM